MQGDPSIRYQTMRDLLDASPEDIRREQQEILRQGWGKSLLDLQEEDGTWSHAFYSPKWTSTFYTLLLLMRMGADAQAPSLKKACLVLLDKGFYEKDGGINYWKTWKQGECCVTGMLLSMLCYFRIEDERIHSMRDYLTAQQMADGGWNCESYRGAVHSSFHTTLSVLEGLREYGKVYGEREQGRAMDFLLEHKLYQSSRTSEPVDPKMLKMTFPPRWHFDILRCLDFFQESDIPKDPAMQPAMDILLSRQTEEGFWKQEQNYTGKTFFVMEKCGSLSRWNTLRALRVLKWWNMNEQVN